jgi:hypothetical protein
MSSITCGRTGHVTGPDQEIAERLLVGGIRVTRCDDEQFVHVAVEVSDASVLKPVTR